MGMRKTKETSPERVAEIVKFALENGDERACEVYGIKSESLNRYRRVYQNEIDSHFKVTATLKKIEEQYGDKELQAIAAGGRIVPGYGKVPMVDFEGDRVKFAQVTDTHFGSLFFHEKHWDMVIDECKKEKVDFICHTGDVSEGMSKRDGHIYELSHLGYEKQKDYSIEQLQKWPGKLYAISGNHDRWFLKSSGANIVKDICDALPDAHFLGHDMGVVSLKGHAILELWHGEDGSSYATSYRIQKIIEAFTGGEKPHILECGHTHKQLQMYERHIHAFSGGSIQCQTLWMKGKRMQAHTGFWIITAWINKNGVAKLQSTWYPFYA
jgi:predicted phosphodiesterase